MPTSKQKKVAKSAPSPEARRTGKRSNTGGKAKAKESRLTPSKSKKPSKKAPAPTKAKKISPKPKKVVRPAPKKVVKPAPKKVVKPVAPKKAQSAGNKPLIPRAEKVKRVKKTWKESERTAQDPSSSRVKPGTPSGNSTTSASSGFRKSTKEKARPGFRKSTKDKAKPRAAEPAPSQPRSFRQTSREKSRTAEPTSKSPKRVKAPKQASKGFPATSAPTSESDGPSSSFTDAPTQTETTTPKRSRTTATARESTPSVPEEPPTNVWSFDPSQNEWVDIPLEKEDWPEFPEKAQSPKKYGTNLVRGEVHVTQPRGNRAPLSEIRSWLESFDNIRYWRNPDGSYNANVTFKSGDEDETYEQFTQAFRSIPVEGAYAATTVFERVLKSAMDKSSSKGIDPGVGADYVLVPLRSATTRVGEDASLSIMNRFIFSSNIDTRENKILGLSVFWYGGGKLPVSRPEEKPRRKRRRKKKK
jgi:hypothetical protein